MAKKITPTAQVDSDLSLAILIGFFCFFGGLLFAITFFANGYTAHSITAGIISGAGGLALIGAYVFERFFLAKE